MTKTSFSEAPAETRPRLKRNDHFLARLISSLTIVTLFATGMSSSVTETEANWNNSEHVVSSAIAAATVGAPRNLQCNAPVLIGRPSLEWRHPPEGPPDNYVMEIRHNASGATNQYVFEDGNTTRVVLTDGLLSDLLGNLLGLGGNFTARVQAVGPGGWTSEFSNSATFYPGLLGILLPSCR